MLCRRALYPKWAPPFVPKVGAVTTDGATDRAVDLAFEDDDEGLAEGRSNAQTLYSSHSHGRSNAQTLYSVQFHIPGTLGGTLGQAASESAVLFAFPQVQQRESAVLFAFPPARRHRAEPRPRGQ